LMTTGIAQTTPAAVPTTEVITSMRAIWACSPVRTAKHRQANKDRGRHVGSRVNGRILEAELRHDHPVRAMLGGGR
jgi:hypothetical protein